MNSNAKEPGIDTHTSRDFFFFRESGHKKQMIYAKPKLIYVNEPCKCSQMCVMI